MVFTNSPGALPPLTRRRRPIWLSFLSRGLAVAGARSPIRRFGFRGFAQSRRTAPAVSASLSPSIPNPRAESPARRRRRAQPRCPRRAWAALGRRCAAWGARWLRRAGAARGQGQVGSGATGVLGVGVLLGGLGSGQRHQGSSVDRPEAGAEQLCWSGTLLVLH
jgi:hypothetical protein